MLDQLSRLQPLAHNLLRIFAGFMFFTHGGQKLFAWFGREESVELMTRWGIAGAIETVAGVLITLGLFTRVSAFIASGEMAVAYFWIHAIGQGSIWHWANRGELAALYCFIFLYLAAAGGGTWSLDGWLAERRKQLEATPVRGGPAT